MQPGKWPMDQRCVDVRLVEVVEGANDGGFGLVVSVEATRNFGSDADILTGHIGLGQSLADLHLVFVPQRGIKCAVADLQGRKCRCPVGVWVILTSLN